MAQSTRTAAARWRSRIARTITVLVVALAAYAPVSPAAALGTTAVVSTGTNHTCAIDTDGTLWCWGWTGAPRGFIGDGTTATSSTPVQVGTDTDWVTVSAGEAHSCALKSNGTLWCWGSNFRGQLGIGTFSASSSLGADSPVQVGSDTDWRTVSSGRGGTCAVKTDNTLYCWGYNADGQLGDGTTTSRPSPTLIGSNYLGVSTGWDHSCALAADHSIRCWGWNPYGAIGDGTTTSRLVPTTVGTDTDWSGVSAGSHYSCAIKSSGEVFCWGLNAYGETGTSVNSGLWGPGNLSPLQVGTDTDWTAVTAGNRQSCATKADGSMYCWGQNKKGELGGSVGDLDLHPAPTLFVNVPDPAPVDPAPVVDEPNAFVPSFGPATARAASSAGWSEVRISTHACATTTDNRIYCWGDGATGALGQGTTASSKKPLQVALGTPAAPSVVADPSIATVPQVGEELTGLAGSWNGAPVPSFSYQWFRCTKIGVATSGTRVPAGCTKISGATSLSYTPVRLDNAKRLRLGVTAVNTIGTLVRYSSTSAPVVTAPYNLSAPAISGTVRVGKVLTARAGTFAGTTPVSFTYQWYACSSKVKASASLTAGCVLIDGATASRFTITGDQAGKFLVVGVTATNSYGEATHYSAATVAVR